VFDDHPTIGFAFPAFDRINTRSWNLPLERTQHLRHPVRRPSSTMNQR